MFMNCVQLKSVDHVAPFIFVGGTIDYEAIAHSAFVIATSSDWFQMRLRPLAEGRVFTADEHAQRVCVLSQKQREEIFGTRGCWRDDLRRGHFFQGCRRDC